MYFFLNKIIHMKNQITPPTDSLSYDGVIIFISFKVYGCNKNPLKIKYKYDKILVGNILKFIRSTIKMNRTDNNRNEGMNRI